jgi:hypothetical protein
MMTLWEKHHSQFAQQFVEYFRFSDFKRFAENFPKRGYKVIKIENFCVRKKTYFVKKIYIFMKKNGRKMTKRILSKRQRFKNMESKTQ